VDLVHLIQFIVTWEQGEEREDFKIDAADSPIVHLMIVIAISEQTLRRSVPPCADILCERRLRVDTPT
jgi:hypothetical protein